MYKPSDLQFLNLLDNYSLRYEVKSAVRKIPKNYDALLKSFYFEKSTFFSSYDNFVQYKIWWSNIWFFRNGSSELDEILHLDNVLLAKPN